VTPPLQRGEFVCVSAHGVTKDAMVGLASPNGRSLILLFDGGLFWPGDGGGYVGSMPVFENDNGEWVELINQRPITIERKSS